MNIQFEGDLTLFDDGFNFKAVATVEMPDGDEVTVEVTVFDDGDNGSNESVEMPEPFEDEDFDITEIIFGRPTDEEINDETIADFNQLINEIFGEVITENEFESDCPCPGCRPDLYEGVELLDSQNPLSMLQVLGIMFGNMDDETADEYVQRFKNPDYWNERLHFFQAVNN